MIKKILFTIFIVLVFQYTFIGVYAVKAYPFPIVVTQPDGTLLTIKLHGDEKHHYQSTEDGFLLKQNTKGFYTYATLNTSGRVIESDIIARNADNRSVKDIQFLKTIDKTVIIKKSQSSAQKSKMMISELSKPQKAYPLNGSPKALVILVNFSDKSFVTANPQNSFQNLVTQVGYSANGGTGSAKDYFMASTYGKFSPNFMVVGPVTLPHTLDYYGKNDISGNDSLATNMIVDACAAADAAGLDFTQFDTDGDRYVDNVFVYYAGYNEAEHGPANTIWPHRWSVSSAGITTGITFDGKKIDDYSCTSELKGNTGSEMCGIGTFCHEFGHVLGLPDYYDTSGSQSNTLNDWDIMDYGAYNNNGCTPPVYSAYDRFYLGYLTPVQITTGTDVTLLPLYQGTTQPPNTNNQAFLFSATTHNLNGAAPSPAEFFMVEYRKKTGWDAYLPAEGMCIWHIDYNLTAWNDNTPNNFTGSTQTASDHMRVYLQPLSGQTTTPGTAFTTGSFTPITWAGASINRPITAITKTANNITFKVMGGAAVPTITAGTVSAFAMTVGTPATTQTITIAGAALSTDISVGLSSNDNFDIKLASESTWGKNVTVTQSGGTASQSVQIRYNPTAVGTHTNQLVLTSTGATIVNVNLSGTATLGVNSPVIYAGKIDTAISFGSTLLNVTNSKTINLKTTDLSNNLVLAITGTDATMFNVSVTSIVKENTNGTSGTNVIISYKPTSTGSHTATLTISGGGLSPDRVITLTGNGI